MFPRRLQLTGARQQSCKTAARFEIIGVRLQKLLIDGRGLRAAAAGKGPGQIQLRPREMALCGLARAKDALVSPTGVLSSHADDQVLPLTQRRSLRPSGEKIIDRGRVL